MLRIVNLKTEYRKDPLGIDEKRPRFSWEILSDASGVIQKSRKCICRDFLLF